MRARIAHVPIASLRRGQARPRLDPARCGVVARVAKVWRNPWPSRPSSGCWIDPAGSLCREAERGRATQGRGGTSHPRRHMPAAVEWKAVPRSTSSNTISDSKIRLRMPAPFAASHARAVGPIRKAAAGPSA